MNKNRGVTVIAAILAVLLLGTMGAGVAYFVASNQQLRIQQVTSDQAFYSAQAGLEYGLAQIFKEGAQSPSFSFNFSGETVTVLRDSGKMISSASEKDARATHSITDPFPVSGCFDVAIGGGYISGGGYRLAHIDLQKSTCCPGEIVITSMTGTTWAPNNNEKLSAIRFAGAPDEFAGPPDYSGGVFDFGSNDYVINDNNVHHLTDIQWDSIISNHSFQLHFNFTYAGSGNYTKIAEIDLTGQNQADCFNWDANGARLNSTSGRWSRLGNTTVTNSCSRMINIGQMTTAWTPTSPSRNLTGVSVDGMQIYSGSAGSGTPITVSYQIDGTLTKSVDWFGFDDEMMNRNYSTVWTFGDGTTKTYALNLFNTNQNNCLTIDTSQAKRQTGDYTRVIGLTVQNTCAADIGITSMTLSWSGNPTRRLIEASIDDVDGSNVYSGSYASGSAVNLGDNDLYFPNGIDVKSLGYLRFNEVIATASQFTLLFTMSDGNTKSVTFSVESQAQDLTVNTASATVGGGGNRDLMNIYLTNSGTDPIVWATTTASWTPLQPARTLQIIRANNTNIWTGSIASGTLANNNDVTINGGQTVTINYFRFNANVKSRTFTIIFAMGDGSTKSVGPFTPP